MRSEWGKLSLFLPDDQHREVAQAAKFNLFLDATLSKRQLALLLGVGEEEIYIVRQEIPTHNNLQIIQITGLGMLGKKRRETQEQRADLIKEALRKKYPGLVIGDWKAHTQPGDAQWFVSLRGSNEYEESPALATFGGYPTKTWVTCIASTRFSRATTQA